MGELKFELLFPGDATYTDVSDLVRYDSVYEQLSAFNAQSKRSTIDTFRFSLDHDSTVRDKLFAASSVVLAKVTDDTTRRFTGVVAPTFRGRHWDVVDPIYVEIEDASYLLDRPLSASINWPATVGGSAYKICDPSDTSHSIVHQLLTAAGYDAGATVDPGCLSVTTAVQHFAAEAGESTYRELLDDLLFDYHLSFRFLAGGTFTLIDWSPSSVSIGASFSGSDSSIAATDGLRVEKRHLVNDGAKVTYAKLATKTGALLYRANLPLSTADGELGFTGEVIAAGDYYPPDGDIEDAYQQFRADWLDEPYLSRQTRLRNKDLSLVSSSGHVTTAQRGANVVIDTEEYEPLRARVLFQNTGAATEKIETFEIHGNALHREKVVKATYPSTAADPVEHVSRFIFDDSSGEELAVALGRDILFGDFAYAWPSETSVAPGTICELVDSSLGIDTTVIITEREYNPDRFLYHYRAIAIAEFSADTVLRIATEGSTKLAQEALTEAQVAVVPTYEDMDEGYESPRTTGSNPGTTTPTVPSVTAESAEFNVALFIDVQTNLTNPSHYEWQVSDDAGTTAHALAFDGSGLGATDPGDGSVFTSRAAPFFVHGPLPLNLSGGTDNPAAKTWHYRCRRVTKRNDKSAWSSWTSAQSLSVGAGRLGAGVVFANNIYAGVLNTLVANIKSELVIDADDGWVAAGVNYRAYLDEDEITLQEDDGGWSDLIALTVTGATFGVPVVVGGGSAQSGYELTVNNDAYVAQDLYVGDQLSVAGVGAVYHKAHSWDYWQNSGSEYWALGTDPVSTYDGVGNLHFARYDSGWSKNLVLNRTTGAATIYAEAATNTLMLDTPGLVGLRLSTSGTVRGFFWWDGSSLFIGPGSSTNSIMFDGTGVVLGGGTLVSGTVLTINDDVAIVDGSLIIDTNATYAGFKTAANQFYFLDTSGSAKAANFGAIGISSSYGDANSNRPTNGLYVAGDVAIGGAQYSSYELTVHGDIILYGGGHITSGLKDTNSTAWVNWFTPGTTYEVGIILATDPFNSTAQAWLYSTDGAHQMGGNGVVSRVRVSGGVVQVQHSGLGYTYFSLIRLRT